MISAYLDELLTIEEIINAANELSLKRIPLRNIDGKNIYHIEEEKLNEIERLFKSNKIKIELIDIIQEYDIYDLINLEKIVMILKTFGCKTVVMNLPTVSNFDAEKEQMVVVVNDLLNHFKKEKIDLIFHVNYKINSGYIAYLIKKVKELEFLYSPADCYLNNQSITTYYRLLRNKIKVVVLYDVDENKKPTLIGYGKALVLDIIDNLNRDKYKGEIYYDFNLSKYVKTKKEKKEEGFFKRLFTKKRPKAHQIIDERLRLEEDEDIGFVNLLDKQLKIIRKYKNI